MNIPDLIPRQRAHFTSGATLPLDARQAALRTLGAAVAAAEPALLEALRSDLGKSAAEAYLSETGFVQSEIRHALHQVRSWMRPRRGSLPLAALPGRAYVRPEPKGVVLIIGPWNYPVQLILGPLAGALAAGNCVVIKPSEHAPHTSAALREMLAAAFPPDLVQVVEGGRETAEALLEQRFDHIFFTGSTAVGQKVMAAAARHLTPVTLELGGKSPCIVCADAPLEITARRILWGKCLNAGQTCVAPDYVLVPRSLHDPLVQAMRAALRQFYGDDPRTSPDFGRIIHAAHHARLVRMLDGATVLHGGEHDAASRYFAPTLLGDISPDAAVMREEIFGPVLPLLPYESLDEALAFIRARPDPLALYLFTRDPAIQQRVELETRSGGVCMNDTLVHLLPKDLPFGGRGLSGMGSSHGRFSFDAFSHQKTVVRRSFRFDFAMRYPPVKTALTTLKRVSRFLFS